ncbi:DMT family transporter [Chthonobacter rhizosphaerae]|uniref:DMT family transporter n=1 Tax=Chthonobacter rhizosphaerae TaxID=2735553 RepID=UPI0015EED4C4|nr:DMT family transporter [Chthonobacter rhizosphaerae]
MGGADRRLYGMALVAVGTVLWSTAGLFMRSLDLDVWTVLGWRALFGALALWLIVLARHGRKSGEAVRSIGLAGLVAVPITAASMVSYVAALKLTTVANVLAVYATVPFLAALIAWVWLGERATPRVLQASGIALVGILVVTGFSARPEDVAGSALAFVMTASFAVVLVMARRYPGMEMASLNALGAGLAALLAWPMMGEAIPPARDLLILAGFGVTTSGLAYLLFLVGGRHIRSSEAGLIGMTDVVLGPLWVWLAFGENPGVAAVVGCAIVMAAVGWYLMDALRAEPAGAGGG